MGHRVAIAIVATLPACGRVGFDAVNGDAAAATCAHLFCSDFEVPMLPEWLGAEHTGGATVTRDPAFGRTGASLHAVAPAGSDLAAEYVDAFPAAPPTHERVRVYIYAPSTGTLDSEPVEIANPGRNNQIVFSLYADSVDIHAHNIAADFNVTRQVPPPRDQWVCWELHVEIAALGVVELYRDGTLVASKTDIDTRPSSGDLSRVRIGFPSKPTNTSEELWFDDAVADTSPIGCN